MEISRPFIRLPYAFDAERMAVEVARLPEPAWMAHPSGMEGNSAVALISRDARDNDDFDGPMEVTPHLERCTYLKQVMASFGEVLGRSRLMRLAPGCEVALHVDFNYHWLSRVRIHVPIVTHPSVMFQCADEQVHMRAGECWIFNSWRRHRVVNGGDCDRIHLVIDTSGSSRFWRQVRQMAASGGDESIEAQIERIPYVPGVEVELQTERYNTTPVMSPGEVDGLVAELIREFEGHPGNDPALIERYRDLLVDFSKDWRETWYRYGYRRSGWPHYRAVIENLRQRLHPNPRALVTRSNEVGVNPIIVQRILRPALSTDRFDQFVEAAFARR